MSKKVILIFVLFIIVAASAVFLIMHFRASALILGNNRTIPQPPTKESEVPKVNSFEVPILMYHYIRQAENETELGKNLSVSPANFEAQVKYLKENNYRSLKLEDLADPERKTISKIYFVKKKPIVLTFDDGYEDAFTQAFPTLKKYGFSGTFFIIKDYVGKDGRLTEAQISEMEKAGMEFGSHTLSHPDLTKISLDDARSQIFDSKNDYRIFCYPSGRFNEAIVSLVKEADYQVAITTQIGIARENSNFLELPRVRIENTDIQAFADKISYAAEYGN